MSQTPRGLDWAIAKCESLFERGFTHVRTSVLLSEFINAKNAGVDDGIFFTEEDLLKHDAEVIHGFIKEARQFAYRAIDADDEYDSGAYLVITVNALNHLAKTHQKTQEDTNE